MRRAVQLAPYGAALAAAWAVKRFYSGATAEELSFALTPTTWLVARITGADFFFVDRVGYASPELGIAVVPGCAGLNFMIVVFLALVFGFGGHLVGAARRSGLITAAACFAYAFTLVVNALRIASAHAIHGRLETTLALGFDEVHRLVGVVIYVVALFAVVTMAERVLLGRTLW